MKKAKKRTTKRKAKKPSLTSMQMYKAEHKWIEQTHRQLNDRLTGLQLDMREIKRNQLAIARSMAPLVHDLRKEHKKQKGVYTIGNENDLLDLQKLIDEGAKKMEVHKNG